MKVCNFLNLKAKIIESAPQAKKAKPVQNTMDNPPNAGLKIIKIESKIPNTENTISVPQSIT